MTPFPLPLFLLPSMIMKKKILSVQETIDLKYYHILHSDLTTIKCKGYWLNLYQLLVQQCYLESVYKNVAFTDKSSKVDPPSTPAVIAFPESGMLGHHLRSLTPEEEEKLKRQESRGLLSEFQQKKLEQEAAKNWDKFYKRNETRYVWYWLSQETAVQVYGDKYC